MEVKVKRIYTGLPESLANQVLWVERNYRINELSHQPGGTDVVVVYHSDSVFGYDWIKRPSAYIEKILKNDYYQENSGNFTELTESQQILFSIQHIQATYARTYESKAEYESAVFEKVWDAASSTETLMNALVKFEAKNVPHSFANSSKLVELFFKNSLISNIRHISYFLPGLGIENESYEKPFTISCALECGETFQWGIFSKFPVEILNDLWEKSASYSFDSGRNITLRAVYKSVHRISRTLRYESVFT